MAQRRDKMGHELVAEWMAAHGLTETALADRIGVKRQALYYYRARNRPYSGPIAVALADITGIEVGALLRSRAA